MIGKIAPAFCLVLTMFCGCGDDGGDGEDGLPDELPFVLERPAAGTPLTDAEIAEFTKKITGFYRDVEFFEWCDWHSHGMDPSYDPDVRDYGLYWQDTRAVKAGDTITFWHVGWADNLMIRTGKVLNNVAAGYLLSGDPLLGRLTEKYSKGIVALFLGMVWGHEDPPITSIMPRTIFTINHSYTDARDRKVVVDYTDVREEKEDWNGHSFGNPNNPYWGDIWIRNMRSKDDVPHIFRAVPMLQRVARDGQDEHVRRAAQEAYEFLVDFCKDIVDHGYQIRTKDKQGNPYIPTEDLASFVTYDEIIPNAECDPKLTSVLFAYGEPRDVSCGNGISPTYESTATAANYYNYAIIRYFHLTAIVAALMTREDRVAERLLKGLFERVDAIMQNDAERDKHSEWDADAAAFLLASAAYGLPLTDEEARFIRDQYAASVDHYTPWEHWDLYDASVPDGEYEYKPGRDDADGESFVRLPAMTYILEYCYSPVSNPSGAKLVDCEIVADPARWGE
jgi:hypothetical protein